MQLNDLSLSMPQRSYRNLSERIRKFIEVNKYKKGDRLPAERELANAFHVSRGSIREAIKILVANGILRSRQGDGTYVQSVDIVPLQNVVLDVVEAHGQVFDQVMELRRILAPSIAMIAAVRSTPEQIEKMKVLVSEQHLRCIEGKNDGDIDAKFHQMLAECTFNELIIKTEKLINEAYKPYRTTDLRSLEWRRRSVEEHLLIIKALEDRSPEDAYAEIMRHLQRVEQDHLFSKSVIESSAPESVPDQAR